MTEAEIQAAYRSGRLSRQDALQALQSLDEAPGWGTTIAAGTARIALPFVGGALGALSPLPGGMYAGAVAGGALGETLGELFGGEELSGRKIATSGALGLLPGWRAARITSGLGRVALRAAEGGTYGALSSAANAYFGEGRVPTWREVGQGAGFGTVVGGVVGGGLDIRATRQQARAADLERARLAAGDQAVPPPPPMTKQALRRPAQPDVTPAAPRSMLTRDDVDAYWASALPETRVRTPEGKPRRMYHGSPADYGDFTAERANPDALYGPGIYMTDNPDIASGYAEPRRVTPWAKSARERQATAAERERIFTPGNLVDSYSGKDRVLEYLPNGVPGNSAGWMVKVIAVKPDGTPIPGERPRIHYNNPMVRDEAPNVRPLYADIRTPFDVREPVTAPVLRRIADAAHDPERGYSDISDDGVQSLRDAADALEAGKPAPFATLDDVYKHLVRDVRANDGLKDDVTRVIARAGYDGIFHTGGMLVGDGKTPHEVAIAFDPKQVRNAFDLPPDLMPAGAGQGGAPPRVPPTAAGAAGGGGGTPPPGDPDMIAPEDLFVQPADNRAAAKRMFVRRYNPDGTPVQVPRPITRAQKIEAARRVGKNARYIAGVERQFANFPKEARDFLAQIHIDHGDDIMAATGGVEPVTRTQQLAAGMMVDLDNLPRVGTQFNRVQQTTLQGTYAALAANAQEAAEQFRAGTLSWDEMTAKLGAIEETTAKLIQLDVGSASAAGGTLRMRREAIEAGLPPMQRFTKAALRMGATPADAARAMLALGDNPTPRQTMQALMNLRRADYREKVRSLYISNLLAGWAMARNAAGNMIRMVQDPLVKPVAGALDLARTTVRGGERRTYAREIGPATAGMVDAVPTALKAFGQILKRGFTDHEASRLMVSGAKFEIPTESFKGKASALNIVGRVLRGTDVFFRTLNGAAQHRAAAYAQARRELGRAGQKIDPKAFQQRMSELLANPTDGMLSDIEMAAARSVFQEPVPAWVARLSQGIDEIKSDTGRASIRLYLPFVNTPANLVRQAAQFSPAGVFTKGFREASRTGDMIRAETALGTLLAGGIVYGVLNGAIRGAAPMSRGEREAYLAEGPENSVRVGDRWVKFTDLGHIGIAMGTVANATQAYKRRVLSAKPGDFKTPADAARAVGAALVDGVGAAGQSIFDQSFLSGMGELFDAIGDTQTPLSDRLERLAQRRVTALIPGQAILRPLAYGGDPIVRDTKGLGEAVQAQIPGQSTKLMPRLDIFGQPVERTFPGYANTGVFPSVEARPVDPVRGEMNRLGVTPDAPKRGDTLQLAGREWALRPSEDYALRRARGLLWHQQLERTMRAPGYQTLPDAQRKKVIQNAKRAATLSTTRRAAALKAAQRPLTLEALLPQ